MEKSLEIHTISKIDVCKGQSNINSDGLAMLADLILTKKDKRLDNDEWSTHYEDTEAPDCKMLDDIVIEMAKAFHAATGYQLVLDSKWSHIHEKNMSTTIHNHYPVEISAVFYVSVPEGSGKLLLHPHHNKYHLATVPFEPKEGMFLIFPGALEHSVTRNHSDKPRISLAFNFNLYKEEDK